MRAWPWLSLAFVAVKVADGEDSKQYNFQYPFRPVSFSKLEIPANDVTVSNLLSGVAVLDYDGDGFEDFAVARGLYRNKGQKFTSFEDVTAKAFGDPQALAQATALLAADFDNDGLVDLLCVADGDKTALWRNNGDGTFEIVKDSGLLGPATASSAALVDIDNDGYLDVFIAAHGDAKWKPLNRRNYPSKLFLNRGKKLLTFEDATESSGLAALLTPYPGLPMVSFFDYDGDGDLDMLALNGNTVHPGVERGPIFLFEQLGDGTFRDRTSEAGLDTALGYWRGITYGDFNKDGCLDFCATNMGMTKHEHQVLSYIKDQPHGLFLSDCEGTFTNAADQYGIGQYEMGWGVNSADFNNDGFDDLAMFGAAAMRPFLYSNPGRLFFTHQRPGWRGNVTMKEASEYLRVDLSDIFTSGSAIADFDNDGFPDIVVATTKFGADLNLFGTEKKFGWQGDGTPTVLMNNGNGNRYISIELIGVESNRDAVGARVEMYLAAPIPDTIAGVKEVTGGSSFASSESRRLIFGLGDGQDEAANFKVTWPSGKVEHYTGIVANKHYRWKEGTGHQQIESRILELAENVIEKTEEKLHLTSSHKHGADNREPIDSKEL